MRRTPGPSIAKAPSTSSERVPDCQTRAAKAPASEPKTSTSWTGRRAPRPRNVSTMTPSTAAAATMIMGRMAR